MFTNKKRCCLFGFNLVIIGVFLFNVSVLIAQVRPAAQRPTGLPLPSRGGAPVPTPSALPSQQLASQAPRPAMGKQRESCLLRSSRKVGATDMIEIGIEGSGTVIQTLLGNEKTSPSDKMEVVAGFCYEERILDWNPDSANPHLKSIRQYTQAGMRRNFQGTVTRPLLDISRKNIIVEFDGKTLSLYSPAGPFKNDQYLLVSDLPINSILLDFFLPNREVKLGEEWTVPDNVVRALLGLESIENNTVRLVLTAIVDDMAEVDLYLTGNQKDPQGNPLPSTIQGASLGASVTMDIQGKYQFDLKSNRMTWFGMTINEKRSESLVEPGLDWKGTVRIRIAPMEAPEELTDEKLTELDAPPTDESFCLIYNGQKGPWNFRHGRDWRMIEDGETAAALTLIENGDGIAQCNLMWNGKIDLDSIPTIEGYQNELQKGLGDQFGQFVDASEYDDQQGRHIMSVVIDGKYDDIPFRRIYYLLTDQSGYQVTVMYDIAADKLDRFDDSGREIIESLNIIPPPETDTPTDDSVEKSEKSETTSQENEDRKKTPDEATTPESVPPSSDKPSETR